MSSMGQHVAVLAFPFGSHAAPLLVLVRRLARALPTATFSFISTSSSNALIFSGPKDEDVDDRIKPYEVGDINIAVGNNNNNIREQVELFAKEAPRIFKEAVEVAERESGMRVSCFLTDAFLWFAAEMAEERSVSWVPLWTSGPVSLAVHLYTDHIRNFLLPSSPIHNSTGDEEGDKDQLVLDCIPGLSSIRAVDLPEEVVSSNLDSPFTQMLHKMGLTLPRAAAVTINSFEEIDPTVVNNLKSRLKNFLNVGPFTLSPPPPPPPPRTAPDPDGCLAWLDKQKAASVAYISFGTMIRPPLHELAAVAEALEATGVPFVWSLKGFHDREKSLPRGFLERTREKGRVVGWAPQREVLGHESVGAFVSHGGWNSVTESIGSGVPMICRPFLGDQKLNRRMVEEVWRIGVGVEGGVLTKTGLARDLDLLISGHQGKEMRQNVMVLKELALKAVESDGSSAKNFSTLLQVILSSSHV